MSSKLSVEIKFENFSEIIGEAIIPKTYKPLLTKKKNKIESKAGSNGNSKIENKIVIPRNVLHNDFKSSGKRNLRSNAKQNGNKDDANYSENGRKSINGFSQDNSKNYEENTLNNEEMQDSESENVDKNYWVEEDEEEIEEELDDIDEEDYDGMDHSYNKITRTQEESYTFTDGKSEDSHKKLTKRQKNMMRINNNPEMIEEPLMSLPDKKQRKKKNLLLTEEQQIKKLEKEKQRKLQAIKTVEELKQQTVNKILNEAGRMQKLRKEKEEKEKNSKENRRFRTLPENDIKIQYKSTSNGENIKINSLFSTYSLISNNFIQPVKKIVPCCSHCKKQKFKYKLPKQEVFACSFECYKFLTQK